MRGKKFTAAEKHFMDKENKYRKEILQLKSALSAKVEENKELHTELDNLKSDLIEKEDWINRLLSYTELGKEEVQTMLLSEKKKQEAVNTILGIGKVMKGLRYFG